MAPDASTQRIGTFPVQELEPIGGAVPLHSRFYIERPVDGRLYNALNSGDSIVLIKGSRQMGKTSLLARGLQYARQAGSLVVLTDFQKLNQGCLTSSEALYRSLAETIADQLEIDRLPADSWNPRLDPNANFDRYFVKEILNQIDAPLVWAMDEVDRLFCCSFANEVFSLFRTWHNARLSNPEGPWSRVTLLISYATEAFLFINDITLSPFDVGTELELEDFTFDQVAELNSRYGSPVETERELRRFYRLVGGQPYLVRRSLHELATHPISLAQFANRLDKDEGIFGDHLRRLLLLLSKNGRLKETARGILHGHPCPNWESYHRLCSAGVMVGHSVSDIHPRCQLYANYFTRHLG